ncbi:hypothetical protein WICPIJ_001875 [Wickerhamomyces pijperi]|uniref:Uncharacterized protein n=1 Tax=Wickerhamomyces pijperi TaxID=599730 RepID=A0A9P8QCT1_WICPI|nr:hypothetical protein WICPIJ_001875 [Wickerhamomyces pijperi]
MSAFPHLGIISKAIYPTKTNGSCYPPSQRGNNDLRAKNPRGAKQRVSHPMDVDLNDKETMRRIDRMMQRHIEGYWEYKLKNNNIAPRPDSVREKITGMKKHEFKVREPVHSYLSTHSIWEPQMQVDELLGKSNHQIVSEERKISPFKQDAKLGTLDQFTAYIHLACTTSEEPLPPLVYHTACTSNENIYIIGGSRTLYANHTPSGIDMSKFKVIPTDFPPPMDSSILNSACVVPNYECWTMSSQSHVAKKFIPSGDVPPPLMCMSASMLTDRYCFYYGGIELISEVSKTSEGQYVIRNSTRINNCGYILDLQTFKFTKHEMIAHPSFSFRDPRAVPRFAHTATSVTIKKESDTEEQPATVYVMGGFKASERAYQEYEAIQDLWKVEANVTFRGTHGYMEFSKEMIATPLSLAQEKAPPARGFHAAAIFDSEFAFGKGKEHKFKSDEQREREKCRKQDSQNTNGDSTAGSAVTDSPVLEQYNSEGPPPAKTKRTSSKPKKNTAPISNLKLVIHGGTDCVEIFGDVWWFDIESETWHELSTSFNVYDSNFVLDNTHFRPSIVRKCGHVSFIMDCWMVLIVGSIPSDLTLHRFKSKAHDISELFIKLKDMDKKNMRDQYYRYFVLNLKTATWMLYKCFHRFQSLTPGAQSQLSYIGVLGGSAVVSNERIYYGGGFMVSNLKYIANEKSEVLNNTTEIIDFPLSSFNSYDYLKTMTYLKPSDPVGNDMETNTDTGSEVS